MNNTIFLFAIRGVITFIYPDYIYTFFHLRMFYRYFQNDNKIMKKLQITLN